MENLDDSCENVVGLEGECNSVVVDDQVAEAHEHEQHAREHRQLRLEDGLTPLTGNDKGGQALEKRSEKQPERHLHGAIAQKIGHESWAELADRHGEHQERYREDEREYRADRAKDRTEDRACIIEVSYREPGGRREASRA